MSILQPAAKTARVTSLAPTHQTVNTIVAAAPKTPAAVASSVGITAVEATHRLSYLVDEALASRGPGDPNTATYTAL